MKKEHAHILITGLVYPGFLGAFIVEAAQKLSQFSIEQVFLVSALIFHYSGDFIYIADNERKEIFGILRMFLDIVLVVLIFLALRYALNLNSTDNVSCIWGYLALFKFVSCVWEYAGKADKNRTEALIIDSFFLFIYTVGWRTIPSATLSLIFIAFIDASAYVWWDSVSPVISKWRGKQ